ncbi:MAG: HPr-rel-A system PqqD family peptide chaperone [Acidimicrobiia bacterium]|nr:HPr-rel-A system PqqD family peptide chaperone [Acidimicrobiia bacterium]
MAPTKIELDRLAPRRVQWHDHDGQVVIHDPSASTIALNPTAAMLWRRLVEGADRNALVASLMSEFDIDTLVATRDVDAFLAGLAEHGLLSEAV